MFIFFFIEVLKRLQGQDNFDRCRILCEISEEARIVFSCHFMLMQQLLRMPLHKIERKVSACTCVIGKMFMIALLSVRAWHININSC